MLHIKKLMKHWARNLYLRAINRLKDSKGHEFITPHKTIGFQKIGNNMSITPDEVLALTKPSKSELA